MYVAGHVRVDSRIHADRPSRGAALSRELRDGLAEQLDVELEAERGDVAGLLRAEQVAGAPDLEVAHRDREACSELGVVGERGQTGPRLWRELRSVRIEEIRVREHVGSAHAAADLVELGEPEHVGPLDDRACSPEGCRGRTR